MVGLHGFGGIGKTTIARAVYNQISSQFDRCSFLENIRETQEQKNGTISLQNKLISNIVLRMDTVGSINEVVEGKKLIKDRVSLFKVLIVLDDVDEKFIFEDIIGNLGDFASGSRFIITSRDVNVLCTFNKSRCKLYEVGEMNAQFSLELFCKHAFKKNCPSQEYETLSQDIVSIAGGLPLFLEVVGRLLYGQAKEIWEDRLEQLRKVSVRGVSERLKISYNALEYEAQQIFLDIACFYVNMNKEKPTYMWSDLKLFPITNINVLVQRSMIKIGDDNQFQIHDQLRDMGRAIVHEENIEEPWMRSRIWDTEESVDLLRNKKGSKQVKALYADFSLEPQKPLEAEHFLNLPELRYLEAERLDFAGDFNNLVSNLRWLRLQSCVCDSSDQFNNFRMANMVILDLQDSIFVEGDLGCWSQIKMANKLKVVDLSGCSGLTKLPDFPQSGCLELLHLSNVVGGSLGSITLSMELDIKNL
ncbi:unnamed protein product [Linum tenue]|uniref:NB-ARC domain-containing protein n=1 Tax=Linum tenue TaxID=586396 RepID=A0AAV0N7M0_9ROSI|nr:unnamed protein product [Linum tenue]